jgi:hypothetical protein
MATPMTIKSDFNEQRGALVYYFSETLTNNTTADKEIQKLKQEINNLKGN